MSIDWHKHAADFYGEFDHPQEPSLKVKEFADAVRLATATKFGGKDPGQGHATPKEAGAFWREFQQTGLNPDDYLQLLHQMAPLSFRYHGRAPTMREIIMHKEAKPKEMREYYGNLPSDQYPELTAHEFTIGMNKARYYAQMHLRRDPYAGEVALFHSGNHSLQAINDHYSYLKSERDKSVDHR